MKINRNALRFILFILLIAGFWLVGKLFHIDIPAVRTWLSQYPLWLSGLLYIVIYVGVTTVQWFGSIDFFRITGALLFGAGWSTLFVYIAEICNASILFMLSRKLGREFIEQRFHFKDKDNTYTPQTATFWTAVALRINPLVPFRFMDVGFGLSKISFRNYFWAVVVGSPLRIFWLQLVIAGVGEAILKNPMAMMDFLQTNRFAFALSSLYLLGVFVVTGVAVLVNIFKKKIAAAPK